jgi:hypothetical protein
MNNLVLNRNQIEKLYEITQHFKEIDSFCIKIDRSSGIGAGIVVSFSLFDPEDTSVDITDVSTW